MKDIVIIRENNGNRITDEFINKDKEASNLLKIRLDYINHMEKYENIITILITESSIKELIEFHETRVKDIIKKEDVVDFYGMFYTSHTKEDPLKFHDNFIEIRATMPFFNNELTAFYFFLESNNDAFYFNYIYSLRASKNDAHYINLTIYEVEKIINYFRMSYEI